MRRDARKIVNLKVEGCTTESADHSPTRAYVRKNLGPTDEHSEESPRSTSDAQWYQILVGQQNSDLLDSKQGGVETVC